MNVLVYFENAQQQVAQRTVALLAQKFAFDLDLLASAAPTNLKAWRVMVRGQVTMLKTELKAEGTFEQAVVKACGEKRYDLVVAAPQDRRGLVRILLGSRIGRLVGVAPATIWVPRGETMRLQRIVVGISGGPQSEQDAQLAARLAMAYDAQLEIVYVLSQVPLFYTTLDEFHEALKSDDQIASMAPGVVELRRIYRLLREAGVKVELVIRSGIVSDELVEVCNGNGKHAAADLLVIGAHAPSGSARSDYLENLAETITESAPCPTLVVHAKSAWAAWEIVGRER